MIKILENCFQNMNCFSWIKLIPVLIHLKYWYYSSPYLESSCLLPHHLCHILPEPTETALQHNIHHVLQRFCYFVLLHSTTLDHSYWIYQTKHQAKLIKCVIKLYTDYNTFWVKRAIHQKAQSLKAAFLSKLHNTVKNNSIFNTKYAEFFKTW